MASATVQHATTGTRPATHAMPEHAGCPAPALMRPSTWHPAGGGGGGQDCCRRRSTANLAGHHCSQQHSRRAQTAHSPLERPGVPRFRPLLLPGERGGLPIPKRKLYTTSSRSRTRSTASPVKRRSGDLERLQEKLSSLSVVADTMKRRRAGVTSPKARSSRTAFAAAGAAAAAAAHSPPAPPPARLLAQAGSKDVSKLDSLFNSYKDKENDEDVIGPAGERALPATLRSGPPLVAFWHSCERASWHSAHR